MRVLRRIERYMRRAKISATRLGREAVRDPRLVFDLRRGRTLRYRTEARLLAWLDEAETRLGGEPCQRR